VVVTAKMKLSYALPKEERDAANFEMTSKLVTTNFSTCYHYCVIASFDCIKDNEILKKICSINSFAIN